MSLTALLPKESITSMCSSSIASNNNERTLETSTPNDLQINQSSYWLINQTFESPHNNVTPRLIEHHSGDVCKQSAHNTLLSIASICRDPRFCADSGRSIAACPFVAVSTRSAGVDHHRRVSSCNDSINQSINEPNKSTLSDPWVMFCRSFSEFERWVKAEMEESKWNRQIYLRNFTFCWRQKWKTHWQFSNEVNYERLSFVNARYYLDFSWKEWKLGTQSFCSSNQLTVRTSFEVGDSPLVSCCRLMSSINSILFFLNQQIAVLS